MTTPAAFKANLTLFKTALEKGDLLTKDLKVVHKGGFKWVLIVLKNALSKLICCGKDVWAAYRINNVAVELKKYFLGNGEGIDAEQLKMANDILGKLEEKAKKSKSAQVYQQAIKDCRDELDKIKPYDDELQTVNTPLTPVTTVTTPVTTVTTPVTAVTTPLTPVTPVTTPLTPVTPVTTPVTVQVKVDQHKAKEGIITFANNLYAKISQDPAHKGKSFSLSPLSLIAVLSMFLKAVKEKEVYLEKIGLKGFTEEQAHKIISEILQQTELGKFKDGQIELAQGLGIRKSKAESIHKDFTALVKDTYKAELFVSDKIKDEANEWCNKKTHGKIPSILTDEPDFVFLNAIYLELKWQHKFEKEEGTEWPVKKFAFADGSRSDVAMMSQEGSFPVFEGDDFRMLEKFYKAPDGRKLSQLFFLPNKAEDLDKIETRMTPEFIKLCRQAKNVEVMISLPKIKSESTLELLNILKDEIGLPLDAVDNEMLRGQMVTGVTQKTFVENDAEGTKAAAVTALCTKESSFEPATPDFIVDHSYAYMIMDGENMLFRGRVVDKAPLLTK